ncbi:hypothetical protein JFK97_05850 [Chromobacterium phragmitis]|uniref:hypothetical protein n=1 Tax=Chromobacterium amazonense TaxID=1382803 RepID=UPI0021B7BB1F|nr:hypothetical protein [Chromobacterium amazonense]MBM2883908.1 hypothetical protein [Chromobacterium amazonense]MDE1711825.1 hypothetical protein [Chromobacterium amazonense]
MAYFVEYGKKFALEFSRYPDYQQDKILDFVDTYERFGLGNFNNYPGKISKSWSGLMSHDPLHAYAVANSLWHYHIGLPDYKSVHQKYQTSDWVLHFKWPNMKNTIVLVDVCYHYRSDGSFYLPDDSYMDQD